jgi:molybdopterin-synthase adenylyltransferase
MRLAQLWHRIRHRSAVPARTAREVDVRITEALFERVREHVENFRHGEEAGFLLCGLSRLEDRDVLIAREWIPIPPSAIERGKHGSVLGWSADFNSEVLVRAVELDCSPVLVHSHGSPRPSFSPDDRRKEAPLFGAFSRIVDPLPTGTLLLGDGDAAGSFWLNGHNDLLFRRLVIVGQCLELWPATPAVHASVPARARIDRQTRAIGPASDAKLASATVGVLGVSGGGSHVVQQLAHQGIGTLIPVDDQLVDETNLGRLVGAVHADIDITPKVTVAYRVATNIDPNITVVRVPARFPSPKAIAALKEADVVVACLDRFDAREDINAFCQRYLIPLIDVGMAIRSTGESLAWAYGQVIISRPGYPCMRCWFITDALLEHERQERPLGYDQNPGAAGEPQVVSMNGVIASEACNCVLDLITGYSGGRRPPHLFWHYDGRTGQLEPTEMPPRHDACPACAEQGRADPAPHQPPKGTPEP